MDKDAIKYLNAVLLCDDSVYAFTHPTQGRRTIIAVTSLGHLPDILSDLKLVANNYGLTSFNKLSHEQFTEWLETCDVEQVPMVAYQGEPNAHYHAQIREEWAKAGR